SRWQGLNGLIEHRGAYAQFYRNKAGAYMGKLNDRVQRHVLLQLGFDNVENAKMAGRWLNRQELTWNWRKAARSAVWDPGSIDAFAQVVRTFFESGGDMDTVTAKIADEMFLALPVVGQVESARRGGLTGIALMGVAMSYPPAGGVLLIYSLGEATYTIIDLEYLRPRTTNIIEAVYRGFVGPETYDFGEAGRAGVTWDDRDEAELKKLTLDFWAASRGSMSRVPETPTKRKRRIARITNLEKQIETLETRKKLADESGGGSWFGGKITGSGAQTKQKFIDNYLLKEVTPRIGYFTKATVDLRVLQQFRPETYESQLTRLDQQINEGANVEERLEASAQRNELILKKKRYDEATKWMALAKENREIWYRFQRDSLYLTLRDKYRNTSDPQIDQWVDEWFSRDENAVIEDLIRIALLSPDARAWRTPQVIELPNMGVRRIPGENPIPMDELKAAMRVEVARSRRLFAQHEKQEQERLAANRRNLEDGKAKYTMEMMRPTKEQLDENKPFQQLLKGLRYAAVPRHAPKLEATVYKVAVKQDPSSSGQAAGQGPTFDWSVATKLSVDHTLYFPPYSTKTDYVPAPAAQQALASGKIRGIPLLPDTRRALRKMLEENKKYVQEDAGVVALISAFASDMADLSQAMPETIAHLPSVKSTNRDG
ncbi:MAG: hypothetical protein ACC645_25820, partial [Pirellulales bacterium]